MRTQNYLYYLSMLILCLSLVGCGQIRQKMVHEELPTISHVHIGHAVTGWKHTPDKKGLFVVADEMSATALSEATAAEQQGISLKEKKDHIKNMLLAINPKAISFWKSGDFGLERALDEAVDHITYAAESDDASQNVKDFTKQFAKGAEIVLERCKLIIDIGKEAMDADSMDVVQVLAEELVLLNTINANGDASLSELGIAQLKTSLDEMISQEDPGYEPVAARYLFGIVRLPSGKWMFSWLLDDEESDGDGGGGGY